jgi:hypothetical protein
MRHSHDFAPSTVCDELSAIVFDIVRHIGDNRSSRRHGAAAKGNKMFDLNDKTPEALTETVVQSHTLSSIYRWAWKANQVQFVRFLVSEIGREKDIKIIEEVEAATKLSDSQMQYPGWISIQRFKNVHIRHAIRVQSINRNWAAKGKTPELPSLHDAIQEEREFQMFVVRKFLHANCEVAA